MPVPVVVDRAAIRAFVDRIEREQALEPVDAALNITLTSVTVTPPSPAAGWPRATR